MELLLYVLIDFKYFNQEYKLKSSAELVIYFLTDFIRFNAEYEQKSSV